MAARGRFHCRLVRNGGIVVQIPVELADGAQLGERFGADRYLREIDEGLHRADMLGRALRVLLFAVALLLGLSTGWSFGRYQVRQAVIAGIEEAKCHGHADLERCRAQAVSELEIARAMR